MAKIELPPSEGLYPLPVVLVSCLDKKTLKSNIITIAWCGVICSNPPQLSISIRPSRYSHKVIKESAGFVINIPTKKFLKEADLCGIRSGRDTDKFKACSFTAIPSPHLAIPMIKECPVNIECRLKDVIRLGSHDMFIGEVIAIHADEEISDGKSGIDYGKSSPFVYNQGEYWDLGSQIGFYGFSAK